MASSSTSSIQKTYFKYDVFLSFRGEDTRKNFVDHLYYALQQKNIHTYKDDERIETGKRIRDELIKSIEDSRFHIIIFSKNYASSSWCLDELVKIMELQKNDEHFAYPVFYDVEPFEVRKQIGEFGKGFAKHKMEEDVEQWRKALEEVASLVGWELKNTIDGYESKFIQKIVEEISLELHSINFSVDENLIGMESRTRDVVSSLETDHDDVCMIGIKGMGGGGKTTLARAIFDQISIQFEGKSFVENVREVSKASLYGLRSLQKQVVSDVLNEQGITINSVPDGKNMMKKMMRGRVVLLVLDDVDHIDQLEALAGEPNWFKPGSIVIITTRDEQVLVAHRVKLIRDVNLLSYEEAICLFSRHAFGRDIPIPGYEKLVGQVVGYAAGLPLTIRVLGSFLCGKNELEWHDAIKRLKKIPLKETLEKLELSYNSLEDDYKEMFLDVACIMIGWVKKEAIEALESCGFHARNGLRVLEQKSLITISKPLFEFDHEFLGMHDHIAEMGINIVRRLHPDEPHRHSRLWINKEIKDILANNRGTKATRCMELDLQKLNPEVDMKGLKKMKNLRFLKINPESDIDYSPPESDTDSENENINYYSHIDWNFDEVSQNFPNALRYLRWDKYPFSSLLKPFQANTLVGLEMSFSKIEQLWEGGERKVLDNLKLLTITNSKLRLFDLGLTPNLEMLNLFGCKKFVKLDMPHDCPKLKSLDLSCSKSKTLDLRLASNLERLDLRRCDHLEELHMPIGCPKLKYLDLNYSKLKPFDLWINTNIETLRLRGCDDFKKLHMPQKLKYLGTLDGELTHEKLSLVGHDDFLKLHMPARCPKLKSLYLSFSKLRALDLGLIPNIEKLTLDGCKDLVELHIPVGCSKLKSVDIMGCLKLNTLDFRQNMNLKTLSLKTCDDLVKLLMPVGCSKLKSLKLSVCIKLKTLDCTQNMNLKTLSLRICDDLVKLHMPLGSRNLKSLDLSCSKLNTLDLDGAPNLETLTLKGCDILEEILMRSGCPKLQSFNFKYSKLRTLDLRLSTNLERLYLEGCKHLVEISMPVECPKLITLDLRGSKLRILNLGHTPNLEQLDLGRCHHLVKLYMPVECPKLKTLNLKCSKLRTLKLGRTPNLMSLNLGGCLELVKVCMSTKCLNLKHLSLHYSKLRTFNLGLTPNLESLDLKGCYNLVKLHTPVGCLKNLTTLFLSDCLRFEKFTFIKRESIEFGFEPGFELTVKSIGICPLHPDNNLPNFQLSCFNVESENFEKLISVGLCACTKLESFYESICDLRNLRKLILIGSTLEAPKDLDRLQCVEELTLKSMEFKHLRDNICMLKHLKVLILYDCKLLEKLPEDFDRLQCLEELTLTSTKIIHLPDSICMLKHLKLLQVTKCNFLEKLPIDLGRLQCLEMLILLDCVVLRDIPNSICKMKHLKYFDLRNCYFVDKLPEELGDLKDLEELFIEGTCIKHLPRSIFLLKGLRIVWYKWLLRSCGFTSEIQTTGFSSFCFI